ncbi:MAG: phosphoribosyltransferase family protein [archaeon]
MARIKLQYPELDEIVNSLFENINTSFTPDTIIHPGIRTDYLINKARNFFNQEPYVIDTSRPFPFKRVMRKFFCEYLDSLPEFVTNPLAEAYIKIVHAEKKKPAVAEEYIERLPKSLGNVLILDDVFCTGHTIESISSALLTLEIKEIKTGVLIFTPRNESKPDYYALEGSYSLPWRNIGI